MEGQEQMEIWNLALKWDIMKMIVRIANLLQTNFRNLMKAP